SIEDGALFNFIRDTETNSSCPCVETQARLDLGRFMPHPRCSQTFRDITCTSVIGSKNCYMSHKTFMDHTPAMEILLTIWTLRQVAGAGVFNTIDNDKFIFKNLASITFSTYQKTVRTPEVRIQVRMERYPNRKIFGLLGRYISQAELVQPTNATVITGIAMEATGTDRVHIVVRKDTRRFRYRTDIIVGNILRYFDTIRLQRFKGVLVYVNNVERWSTRNLCRS
ncbi:hypothetical protein KIN20_035302, partial [Parelaphostrongylus tenuis]